MTDQFRVRGSSKTSVFVSYSRKDTEFRERLTAALEAHGYAPIFDQSKQQCDDPELQLTAQDEWWIALKSMIAASDVMVFIVSPDSAASAVCDDEIAHARSLGKRVIAILRREIDFSVAPERLRSLNIRIDFRNEDEQSFLSAFSALSDEINLDIEWYRRGSRLIRQASHWQGSGRPEGHLLRAGAITEAEAWATRRPGNAPEPGPLLLEFLDANREIETRSLNRLRRTTALGFVPSSADAFRNSEFDRTLRLILAASVLSNDPKFELTPELLPFVAPSCLQLRLQAKFSHESRLTTLAVSPRDSLVVIGSSDRSISVRQIETGALIVRLTAHNEGINCAKFSLDGAYLATASGDRWISDDNSICIWSTTAWELVAKFPQSNNVKWCGVTSDGLYCFAVDHLHYATVYAIVSKVTLLSIDLKMGVSGNRCDEPCPVALIDGSSIFIAETDGGGVFYQLGNEGAKLLTVVGSAPIDMICVSDKQQLIACFRRGGCIQLLSPEDLRQVGSFYTNIVRADNIKFADGAQKIIVSFPECFEILAASDGSVVGSGTLNGEKTADSGLRLNPIPLSNRAIVREKGGAWALIDTKNGSEISRTEGHSDLLDYIYIACSPNGSVFVVSKLNGSCDVISSETGRTRFSLVGHKAAVRGIAFADSKIITISDDWTGRIWTGGHLFSGIKIIDHSSQQIIWMGETLVAVGPNGKIFFYDGSCGTTFALPGCPMEITAAWFSKGLLHIVDPKGLYKMYKILPDGLSYVLHATAFNINREWETIGGVVFHHDGSCAAVWPLEHIGGTPQEHECLAEIFSCTTGVSLAKVFHQDRVTGASFSHDGSVLVTTSGGLVDLSSEAFRWDDTVRIWDHQSGREIKCLTGHNHTVCDAVLLTSNLAISASEDGEIKFWNSTTAEEIASINIHRSWKKLAATPDQSMLFGVDDSGKGHFFSIPERCYIGPLVDVSSSILSFCFRGSDGCLALRCADGAIWTVPLGALPMCADSRKISIAIALIGNGIGVTTPDERQHDVLLNEAPKDLYAAALDLWPALADDVQNANPFGGGRPGAAVT